MLIDMKIEMQSCIQKLCMLDGRLYWLYLRPGNTKEGSITVPLTSCMTGLD